jgi:hypothetical protein
MNTKLIWIDGVPSIQRVRIPSPVPLQPKVDRLETRVAELESVVDPPPAEEPPPE